MFRIILLACLIFSTFSLVSAKTYRLYFLGGQSNMDGYGYVNDLPAELRSTLENVRIFHGNTAPDDVPKADGRGIWSALQPGHGTGFSSDGKGNSYSDRFGVELTLALQLQKQYPGEFIAFIKYSRGGSSIDTSAAGQFGCWDPDFRGKTGINQWDHYLACLRSAMAIKDIDGDGEEDKLIPAGIFWMQGESDAVAGVEVAMRYEHHLRRLMDLIRASLREDDLPVVIGKISESGRNNVGKVWTYGELVMYAQEEYVRKDPHAAIVRSTRTYAYSDPWHYNSAGYIELGKEFAKAIIGL